MSAIACDRVALEDLKAREREEVADLNALGYMHLVDRELARKVQTHRPTMETGTRADIRARRELEREG